VRSLTYQNTPHLAKTLVAHRECDYLYFILCLYITALLITFASMDAIAITLQLRDFQLLLNTDHLLVHEKPVEVPAAADGMADAAEAAGAAAAAAAARDAAVSDTASKQKDLVGELSDRQVVAGSS
jgi:hypothetical protein